MTEDEMVGWHHRLNGRGFGWTDVEAEAPVFWPPDVKSQITGKVPDAGKD